MIDFAAQKQKIREVEAQIKGEKSDKRRRDLRKHLFRLHKEMSEAKKWQRGEIIAKRTEFDTRSTSANRG